MFFLSTSVFFQGEMVVGRGGRLIEQKPYSGLGKEYFNNNKHHLAFTRELMKLSENETKKTIKAYIVTHSQLVLLNWITANARFTNDQLLDLDTSITERQ